MFLPCLLKRNRRDRFVAASSLEPFVIKNFLALDLKVIEFGLRWFIIIMSFAEATRANIRLDLRSNFILFD